jgi:hypothetical protein
VDNKVSIQSNNERNRNATKGIAAARLPMQGNYDSGRTYRYGPHTSFAIMPSELVSVKDSAVFERKKFSLATRRVP